MSEVNECLQNSFVCDEYFLVSTSIMYYIQRLDVHNIFSAIQAV